MKKIQIQQKWSSEEIKILQTYHLTTNNPSELEKIFNRKYLAIYQKAKKINVILKQPVKVDSSRYNLPFSKDEIVELYLSGKSAADISIMCNCSAPNIQRILKSKNVVIRSQSETQRTYPINEDFFDIIDTQEKAYILGLLYADGCNQTERNSVILSLQEKDKEILDEITNLIQPTKPLKFINSSKLNKTEGFENSQNQYRLIIANKHISQRLIELGVTKAKTFDIIFPTENQVPKELQRHFIRGYFDGDGYIGIHNNKKAAIDIVGTKSLCESFTTIFKEELDINNYQRQRFPERDNNIWSLAIGGNKQVKKFCEYIYKDSAIHFKRKYQKYLDLLDIKPYVQIKKTTCINCNCESNKIVKGLCNKCSYKLNNGAEKRKLRFQLTGK